MEKNVHIQKIRDGFGRVVLYLNYIGMLACFVTVFIVSINAILRKLSGVRLSIPGSSELAAYFLVVICMLGIPTLHVRKGHIRIDMFAESLPERPRSVLLALTRSIEFLVCCLFAWGGVLKLRMFLETGTRTDVLNMPKWPFALVCLIGFAELALLMGMDAIQALLESVDFFKKSRKATITSHAGPENKKRRERK